MSRFIETVTAKLQAQFPDCWFKQGYEWSDNAITWSGEASYINNVPAFDYNSWEHDCSETIWTMGVHNDLIKFVEQFNCHWECNDPGTYILYKN